jgi:hypothetical protein
MVAHKAIEITKTEKKTDKRGQTNTPNHKEARQEEI